MVDIKKRLLQGMNIHRYYGYRVFCPSGIVKWYIGNDKPEDKPLWVANSHVGIEGSSERARADVDQALYHIA